VEIKWQFGRDYNFLGGKVPLTFNLVNKNPYRNIDFSEYFLFSPGDGKYFGKTTHNIGSYVDRVTIEVILTPLHDVGLEDLPETVTFHLKQLRDEEIVKSIDIILSMGWVALIICMVVIHC
jgi:hypothetical protein